MAGRKKVAGGKRRETSRHQPRGFFFFWLMSEMLGIRNWASDPYRLGVGFSKSINRGYTANAAMHVHRCDRLDRLRVAGLGRGAD